MGFLEVRYWFFLLTIPALAFFLTSASRSYRARSLALGAGEPRRLNLWIPLLASSLLALALMRPYVGKEEISLFGRGGDIIFLLDVSKSMRADDLKPSRLEFAKRKVRDGIALLKRSGRRDRVGLVVFSGTGTLFCPLTIDTSVLSLYLESVDDDMTSDPGSSILAGIKEALGSGADSPHLILLTDGEDNKVDEDEIRKLVEEKGATLSAIGLGTPEGKPIPLEDGRYLKDLEGEIVISKLQEESLKRLTEGLGKYERASLGDNDIASILQNRAGKAAWKENSDSQEKVTEEKVTLYGEIAPWLALVSLLLLIFGTAKKLLPIACAVLSVMFCDASEASAETLHQGYKAYSSGDFKSAEEIFRTKAADNPASDVIESLGHSLYRQEKYPEAAKAYEEMAKKSENADEAFRGSYNLGNARFMAGAYKEAIEAYDYALTLRPGDEKTEFNRRLAEKKLEEQKSAEQEPKEKQESKETERSDSNQSDSQDESKAGSSDTKNGDNGSSSSASSSSGKGGGEKEREDTSAGKDTRTNNQNKSGDEKSRALETFLNGVDDALSLPQTKKRRGSYMEPEQSW